MLETACNEVRLALRYGSAPRLLRGDSRRGRLALFPLPSISYLVRAASIAGPYVSHSHGRAVRRPGLAQALPRPPTRRVGLPGSHGRELDGHPCEGRRLP